MSEDEQLQAVEAWLSRPDLSYTFRSNLRLFWLHETVKLWQPGLPFAAIRLQALNLAIERFEKALKT